MKNPLLVLGLIVVVAFGIWYFQNTQLRTCLAAWGEDIDDEVFRRYGLTKADFCEKGYTPTDLRTMIEAIGKEIQLELSDIEQKALTTYSPGEIDQLFGERLRARVRAQAPQKK